MAESTLSIKLVKAWFGLGLLIAAFHVFQGGIGWSLIELVIPALGLYVLAYRYPWGRIFTVVILLIHFAFWAWDALRFVYIVLRSIYVHLTADEAVVRQLEQLGHVRDPQYLSKVLMILLILSLFAFFLWLILDLLRNENVKKYFVSAEELSAEKTST